MLLAPRRALPKSTDARASGDTNRHVRPNPLFSLFQLVLVEVPYFGLRELLVHHGHSRLPFGFANQGDTLDIGKVPGVKSDVFPEGSGLPTVEIVHQP